MEMLNHINVFKNKCPRKAVSCPKHQKAICVRYIQPEPPLPFKKKITYSSPEEPLEGDTIYHASYRPVGAEEARNCRPKARSLKVNLTSSQDPLQNETEMRTEFKYSWQSPPSPFRPRQAISCNAGPLQGTTTHRHDYRRKPIIRPEPIVPEGNIPLVTAKVDGDIFILSISIGGALMAAMAIVIAAYLTYCLTDRTVTSESYKEVGRPNPPQSCKPVMIYQRPEVPLDGATVTKQSFKPVELGPREVPEWMRARMYVPPQLPMNDGTIYNDSYLPPGIFQPCDETGDFSYVSKTQSCSGTPCLCGIPSATEDL